MHCRFGTLAMTVGLALVGTPTLRAQEQRAETSIPRAVVENPVAPVGAIEGPGGGLLQTDHQTSCEFDAYQHFHEQIACSSRPKVFAKSRARFHGCDKGGCGERCGGLFGKKCSSGCGLGGLGGLGASFGNGTGPLSRTGDDPNVDPHCNFECADCFGKVDFEKRIVVAYAFDGARGRATEAGYGDAHSGQIGVELLPWVLTDGSSIYSRWGVTFLFIYSHWEGNEDAQLQSAQTGNVFSSGGGDTFSLVIGPTYRVDFDVLGVRMSPNATVGMSFDWTDMEGTLATNVNNIRRIDYFKFAGFDVGAYFRLMWDFGITEDLNFGVGGEYRMTPTDVLVRDHYDMRKHLGVVLQLSHQF